MTSKAARKAQGCVCFEGYTRAPSDPTVRETTCKYKYCYSVRCRVCGGEVYGWGPAACPCDGAPRWARYPGMADRGFWAPDMGEWLTTHVAVKPSVARRNRGRR
jgi:hypothetical protein